MPAIIIKIYYIFWQNSAKNHHERWSRLVICGFWRGQSNSVKICITEITENHYMKEEYPREQTEAVGDHHLYGHPAKSGYRLSCFVWENIEVVMSKTCSEGWAVRHRHIQSKEIYYHPVVVMSTSQWNSTGLSNIAGHLSAKGFDRFSLENFVMARELLKIWWQHTLSCSGSHPISEFKSSHRVQGLLSNPLLSLSLNEACLAEILFCAHGDH